MKINPKISLLDKFKHKNNYKDIKKILWKSLKTPCFAI
jgi:hypothetical protein